VGHGRHEAEGLAAAELHRAGAGEAPVHGEGEGQPLRLDQPFQRRQPVLAHVGGAAAPQRPVGIGAEHVARHEGRYAVAEMRLDQGRAGRRLPGLDDADVERGAAARPGEGHVVRA